jgi:hypothetical protein
MTTGVCLIGCKHFANERPHVIRANPSNPPNRWSIATDGIER